MPITVLKNATVFNGVQEQLRDGQTIVVEDGIIREVSGANSRISGDIQIDLRGAFLMPGMIDAHVHVYVYQLNLTTMDTTKAISGAFAKSFLESALMRGFTSVRDCGGADRQIWEASEQGLITGPRLFYSGRAISQTGGHGDFRTPYTEACACGRNHSIAIIADGVDAVREAVREQLRCGAHQIKILASGGTASPSDPIWMLQYNSEEIAVAVEEAARRRTYVMAHAYSAEAIRRCAELGVRSIEHGNLINDEAAAVMAKHGAFLVPTLVTYDTLATLGKELGYPPVSVNKILEVKKSGLESLEICKRAGVKMGFGTDLLGPLHIHQCMEFGIRANVETPYEILRSATSTNAELMNMKGKLGVIAPGALADIIVLARNPLKDLSVFTEKGENLTLIMRGGSLVKNTY